MLPGAWPVWNPGSVAADRRRPARSSRSSDMIPPRTRGTSPTIGATGARPAHLDRRTTASDTDQWSRPVRNEYRVCLNAAARLPYALRLSRRSPLDLETQRPADEGQRLEYLIGWFGRSDLVRVLAEQHCRVDGGARIFRREPLDLAFLDQPVHVPKERLEALRRAVDVDDPRGLIARVPNRVRHARRHGRLLAGTDGAPVAVHEDLERALDHLIALLSRRVHVNGRARHTGLDPVRGLEQLAGRVLGAARDLPPHPHPGTEIEPAIVAAGHRARWGFALVRFGHRRPFRKAPGSRPPLERRAGSSASVKQPMPSAPSMRLPHSPLRRSPRLEPTSVAMRESEHSPRRDHGELGAASLASLMGLGCDSVS